MNSEKLNKGTDLISVQDLGCLNNLNDTQSCVCLNKVGCCVSPSKILCFYQKNINDEKHCDHSH